MGVTTISSKQTSEPRKRLDRLKSVKVANLQDRSRLSLKRKKSGLISQNLIPHDGPLQTSNQIAKFGASPNYMKPTSCSDAKREPNPGDMAIQTRSSKPLKRRIYSLKRPRKMSSYSTRSRLSSVKQEPAEPNIQQLTRSAGSIKLTRIKSVKVSRRRWSKSTFNQASIFRTDDEASSSVEVSVEVVMTQDLHTNDMEGTTSHNATKKPISKSVNAAGVEPVRRLWKIPSQRQRKLHVIKKQSQRHQVGNTRYDLATCSSTIKSSKFPQPVLDSSIPQVCSYTHCSIHGNVHASSSPPLQGFISHKRRSLKKQKSRSHRYKSMTEACNVTDMDDHPHPSMPQTSIVGRVEPTDSEPVGSESVTESTTDVLFDKQKYTNMWKLIYTNSLARGNEVSDQGDEKGRDDDGPYTRDAKPFNYEQKQSEKNNQVAESEKPEFNHTEAIEFVQQAVDDILLLDDCPRDLKDIHEAMESANSPERENSSAMRPPQRQRSKGFQKMRKIIATTKFIKAMEKIRKINPQKPQHLYLEAGSGAERVYLRHWSMDERKTSEEWMLDYALQEVIAKLAPAQREKVAMLTQAFETFSSELQPVGKTCFPEKTPPSSSIATTNANEQQKSVVVKDDDIQKPDDEVLSMLEDALKQQDSISEDFDAEFDMELYEDNSELSGINLHIHDQGGSKGCPVCYPHSFSKEGKEENNFNIEHQQKAPTNYAEQDCNIPESVQENTKHIMNSPEEERSILQKEMSFVEESSQSQDLGDDNFYDCNEIFLDENKYTSMWNLIYKHLKSGIPETVEKQVQCGIDAREQAKKDTKLQQKDAIKLVQDAVEEILQMSEQPSDDQMIIEEYKTEKTKGKTQEELPRYSNAVSKVILCKKFIKAMEKNKKQHSKVGRYIPRQPPSTVESMHLKQQKENEINCDQLMLDFALQQVIGNLGPAKKKKVSLLVEAFERVAVPPEARAHKQVNAVS